MADKILALFFERKQKSVYTYKRKTDEQNNVKKDFVHLLKFATERDFENHELRCKKILIGENV